MRTYHNANTYRITEGVLCAGTKCFERYTWGPCVLCGERASHTTFHRHDSEQLPRLLKETGEGIVRCAPRTCEACDRKEGTGCEDIENDWGDSFDFVVDIDPPTIAPEVTRAMREADDSVPF